MNKFDQVVLGSLDIAQSEALKRKNTELAPEHLLYGLILNKSSYASKAMKDNVKEVEALLNTLPRTSGNLSIDNIRTSPKLQEWITLASGDSVQQGKTEVAEKHLLKFLPQFFPNLKVDYAKFADPAEDVEVPTFLVNLNEMAQNGKLDPVIGRTKEIRSVIEILGRRAKNNPVLVGPAGVGKTAIVEGLAEQIVKGKVPDILKGKTVYSLEMGSLMAGTKYRGDFEERIQNLLKFVKSKAGEVVLFIDEIHQLVGAGRTDGAMDAANLLKPALARGELHCIGATTFDEYQKYILNDPALERRFRSVPVNEPSKEDSVEILMGVRSKMEAHHGIKISDEAVYNAVFLSDQYITDKNLPDKAIDLLDEASSALKLSAEAMPAKLVETEAELRSKKIYAEMDKDNPDLKKDIENLQKKFDEGKATWEKEIQSLKKVSEIKNRLDRLKFELENAERTQNYEEASKIKYMLIPQTEKELGAFSHTWILNKQHIAQVISRQTGIPVEKILKSKQDHILHLEEFLNQRVFGQHESMHEISETLIASYAGLSDETRPLGSFLLLGPTGVGKTETAKALTQYLFDNEENIVRFDLSEYSEKHSVSKLIGAPAGYVGYEEGGVLTEAIRRKPYCVVLFDEIEKAHPDFADILLQILDDGRLTDNKGRTVNFKNTIIMMTSNSKSPKDDFKPEVLGRIDSVLYFHELDKRIMKQLVDKLVRHLNERLRTKKVQLRLDQRAYEALSEQGFDFQYGARPLNSVFQRLITRPLSKKILEGSLPEGEITMTWNGESMVVEGNGHEEQPSLQ
ncbi:ATP-dependent Clp protease ATP-binding subunit [Peredibacter sp. HCB2-198]|uniref:ATP-dependent Clp protease ATP-binding subunit n=1 Tax=Peredibacter sp. HCB2-198 TaxID=3383025 RepID=UPI0038B6150B